LDNCHGNHYVIALQRMRRNGGDYET